MSSLYSMINLIVGSFKRSKSWRYLNTSKGKKNTNYG